MSHGTGFSRYLKLNRISLPGILAGIVSGVFLVSVSSFLSYYIYLLFPVLKELSAVSEVLFHAGNPAEWIFIILVIGVTPAVCEEILFRGYLQGTLERKMREPWIYLFSGILFALYHKSNLSLLSLIAVGVYLGFLYHRFQSLYATMALHFTYNSLIVFLTNKPILPVMFDHRNPLSLKIFAISLSGLVLIILLVFFFVRADKERMNPQVQRPGPSGLSD
jgi:membrane protease YdiL (CAAX protease family)